MGNAVNNRFLDFLSELNDAHSTSEAWDLTVTYMDRLGAGYIGARVSVDAPDSLYLATMPPWVPELYEETVFPHKDPRVEHCRKNITPYFFEKEFWDLAPDMPVERRHFDEEVAAIGARSAVSFPVHRCCEKNWGFFTFATGLGRAEFERMYAERGVEIGLAGQAAYNRIAIVNSREEADAMGITNRERECLLWLSRGHRNDEIAHVLGIRPVTVEFHLGNVKRKLGARTREQALVQALQLNVVTP